MKNIFKKLLMLVLCLSLLTINTGTIFAESKKKVLTFIGDSITYNFPKYHDWTSDLETTYPYIVANEFGYEVFGGSDNGEEPLAIPGGRTTDLLAFISNSYDGDMYTVDQLKNRLADKENKKEAIRTSDIITMQLGYSNFSVYFLNNLEYLLGGNLGEGVYFDTDLSQLVTSKEKLNYSAIFDSCINSLKLGLGKNNLNKLKQSLTENSEDGDSVLLKLKQIYESFRYAYISELVHFDASIKEIRKINKNAEIYVMGLMNPADNLTLSFSISGHKIVVPVHKMFDILFNSINAYMKYYSPQRYNYTFVNPSRNVETYGDVFGRVNDDNAKSVTAGLLKSMFDREKEITNDVCTGAMMVTSQKVLDLGDILEGDFLSNIGSTLDKINNEEEIYKIFKDVGSGQENVNAINKLIAHVFLISSLKGIYVHPTQNGHNAMAKQLAEAIELNNRKSMLCSIFWWKRR